MPDPIRLPLAEAARAIGTTPDALRKKIKRGNLEAVRDNAGRLLVWVDLPSESEHVSSSSSRVQSGQVDGSASQESTHVQPSPDSSGELRVQLARAEEQAAAERRRADELVERLAQQRADYAADLERVRQERDRLLSLVERQSDQVRQLKDARPWWRRLM